MIKPLISICIPAFNVANYVEETISCLLKQSYQNIEIIIVNDGSTDDTLKVLEQFNSSKIKVISVANGGAAKARNIAYQNSTGAYIIFLDADDLLSNQYIENQLGALNGDDESIVISSWGRFYNNDISTFEKEKSENCVLTLEQWITTYWYKCNPMTNPGRAIIPKNIIEKAGLWNEELSLNDDLEFFTRIFLNSKSIIINDDATLYYRSGVNGLSGLKSEKAYLSLYNSILISTEMILIRLNDNQKVKQSCANMWQSFIYEVYPKHLELIRLANYKIGQLSEPNLKYEVGKITKYLVFLLGWKLTKKIKIIYSSKRGFNGQN